MGFGVRSLAAMMYHIGRRIPEIERVTLQMDVRTYRQEARQAIVIGAQQAEATHLLMLDDDHMFSGEQFSILWEAMKADPEQIKMLSALYFTRNETCAPCIFKLTNRGTVPLFYYPENTVYSVDVVGFGFVLFNMDLFKQVNPPWFNLSIGFGEDAAFCARLIHCGIPRWVHTGCKIGHILDEPVVIDEEHYFNVRRQIETGQMGAGEQLASQPEQVSVSGRPSVAAFEQTPESRPWWRPKFTRNWNLRQEQGSKEGPRQQGG